MKAYLPDTAATQDLGRRLGEVLGAGDVVVLSGELGAGKTTLAQGVACGLGVKGMVTSPTFTLIQEHTGRLPFYHLDVYRLEEADAALELGLEEYFYGQGVTVIEWGERLASLLPAEYLVVSLEYAPGGGRMATLMARGEHYRQLIAALRARYGSNVPQGEPSANTQLGTD